MSRGDVAIRTLATVGAIAFVAGAAIHLSTFFPFNGEYLGVAAVILIAPMAMVFGGAILAVNTRRPRIFVPSRGPGLAIALAVLGLFAYAGINFFVTRLPGQPEAFGGGYFLNSHGFRVPINREQYDDALRLQVRLLSGHLLLFIGAGTALLLATLGRPAPAEAPGPAIALDIAQRRIDVSPRTRVFLGVFGVISAVVVAFWLLSGSTLGGGTTIWVIAVVGITLFNVIRYWRWIARGRAETSGRPAEDNRIR